MTGDWLQVALLLASLPFAPERRHPLKPWHLVGTYAYANVVNRTTDSIPVGAIGLKVDRVIRLMGFVPARDSITFRIPYADTEVLLLVDSWWVPIDTREPGVHRIEVRSGKRFPQGEQ